MAASASAARTHSRITSAWVRVPITTPGATRSAASDSTSTRDLADSGSTVTGIARTAATPTTLVIGGAGCRSTGSTGKGGTGIAHNERARCPGGSIGGAIDSCISVFAPPAATGSENELTRNGASANDRGKKTFSPTIRTMLRSSHPPPTRSSRPARRRSTPRRRPPPQGAGLVQAHRSISPVTGSRSSLTTGAIGC